MANISTELRCLSCGQPTSAHQGFACPEPEVALNQGPRRDDGVGSNPDLRAQDRHPTSKQRIAEPEVFEASQIEQEFGEETEFVLKSDYDALLQAERALSARERDLYQRFSEQCLELVACKQDAERYRWLKTNDLTIEYSDHTIARLNDRLYDLDVAIDAAMEVK